MSNSNKDNLGNDLEQTGPLDVEQIKILTQEQQRQEELNKKQKKKHEMTVSDIRSHPFNLKRLFRSFKYAFQGVAYCLETQPNMRIHFIIGFIAVLLGIFFKISESEWLALVLVIGFVIILEFINTAIESLVDLYSADFSYLARIAKDVGAATVLVMAVISVIVGIIIFLPRILLWFNL